MKSLIKNWLVCILHPSFDEMSSEGGSEYEYLCLKGDYMMTEVETVLRFTIQALNV